MLLMEAVYIVAFAGKALVRGSKFEGLVLRVATHTKPQI